MSKRWYVVHVYSGMEKSVHKAMLERIERAGLQNYFGQVLVPSEEVIESKGGQKSISERRSPKPKVGGSRPSAPATT